MNSPLNKSFIIDVDDFGEISINFVDISGISSLRFDTKVTFNMFNSPKHGEKYTILIEYLELVKDPFSC